MLDLGRLPLLSGLFTRLTPRRLVDRAVREAYANPDLVTPEVVTRHHDLLRRTGNRRALLQGLGHEATFEIAELRSVRQPALLLWGAHDRLIAVETARSFDRDLPDSDLVVYDDLGHVPMEEAPNRTANDARAFLTETTGGN